MELSTRLAEVFAAEQALAAQRLALIAEIDGRGQPRREGATGTTAWLRDKLRVGIGTAASMLHLARNLATATLGATAQALAQGDINTDQATVITRVIGDLPGDLEPAVRAHAQGVLLGYATQFAARDLAVLGSRVLEHVAPEIAEEHQRQQMKDCEAQARRERGFTLSPEGLGRVRLRGVLDTESAATINAAIGPLCAPPQAHRTDNPAAGETGPDPDRDRADERTAAQKRADALIEVCKLALATGELPAHGGEPPQLIVTMRFNPPNKAESAAPAPPAESAAPAPPAESAAPAPPAESGAPAAFAKPAASNQPFQMMAHGTPVGRLDTGEAISPEASRRLACDAKVTPVVLGGAGQVLDVGRTRRLFTGAIRKALMVRDGGCAFAACDRPPRWTAGHHIRHWLDGGVTSVDNGVMLCHAHHVLVHEGGWQVRLGADRLPEFIPPSYVDPTRTPRRNHYHNRN